MNPIENRQLAIEKAIENLENFRLDKIAIFNKGKAIIKSQGNSKGLFIFLTFIALCVLSAIFPSQIPYFLFGFLIVAALLLDATYAPNKTHINAYQQTVKKDLIEAAFPTVQYVGNGYLFKRKIFSSLLTGDDISVKDHFQGQTKNGYPFEFAAIEFTTDSSSLFQGFVFAITSNDIACEEIVVLKKASYFPQISSPTINGIYPEFERFYSIFSKNAPEAKKY